MNETLITVVGHVATDPTLRTTASGVRVAGFRLASTERRFDKGVSGWRDVHTTFYTVTSWRNMAENVCQSVEKGQPVVVTGRLRDSSYDGKDGQRRMVFEIEAFAIGHDLARGVASFTRATTATAANAVRELEEAGDLGPVDPETGELLDRLTPEERDHADDEDDEDLAPAGAPGAALGAA